jgi:hypothetical protein
MTTFGKHSTSGLILSDPRTLTRPRPPWRRRDLHRERCGVCGIGAVYVVTVLLTMQSPTLSLPATLVVLSCEKHSKRAVAAVTSLDVHVREELLYETWGLRWTMLMESVATPFAWLARKITAGWRTVAPVRAARSRDRAIRDRTAQALHTLEQATTRQPMGPTTAPPTKPLSLRGSIDLSNASKP